jgi:integrase
VCVLTGLGKFVCRLCRDENGAYVSTLDTKKICARCGKSGGYYPKFVGKTPHDFRRTACHEMELAGVPRDIAKEVSGHKTDSMFRRYSDLFSDAQKVERQLEAQTRRAEFMEVVAQSDKNHANVVNVAGIERKMLN